MPRRKRSRKSETNLMNLIETPVKKERPGVLVDSEDLVFENEQLQDHIFQIEHLLAEQGSEIKSLKQKLKECARYRKEREELIVNLRNIIRGKEQERLDAIRFIADNPGFLEIS